MTLEADKKIAIKQRMVLERGGQSQTCAKLCVIDNLYGRARSVRWKRVWT